MNDTIEGFTECSHGWRGAHCVRDNEGSCPFEYDRDNPQADCRCKESRWVVVPVPVIDEAMIERLQTNSATNTAGNYF